MVMALVFQMSSLTGVVRRNDNLAGSPVWRMITSLARFLEYHMAFSMSEKQLQESHEVAISYLDSRFQLVEEMNELFAGEYSHYL